MPLHFLQLDAAALWVYEEADGKEEGPFSLAHLRELVIGGLLSPKVQVRIQGRSGRAGSCLNNCASTAVAIMLRCEVTLRHTSLPSPDYKPTELDQKHPPNANTTDQENEHTENRAEKMNF